MNDIASNGHGPSAGPDRWRPARAGLTNVWRYWDETFEFHHGRLLLRGPNGSGKSLGLELLLPFLLDANAQPSRLTSAARSRGGLYERMIAGATSVNRVGFVWVEFRRGDEVFTIGARLRASQNTRRAETTFFTTSLVVGESLMLLDDLRAPLERKALIEAIGTTGRVSDRGQDHRSAVREKLYPGFTEDRYDALITALLALRKEKLSQGLDLDKMSDILSHALPPLEEHDLAAVAEGFERLDRRKAELAALESEVAVVARLAIDRRRYAQAVSARTATEVRRAESRRDTVTRSERQAQEALVQIEHEVIETEQGIEDLRSRSVEVDSEIGAIQGTAAYRDGAALADLAADADRLKHTAEIERTRRDKAVALADRRGASHRDAIEARDQAQHTSDAARTSVRAAASHVGADELAAAYATPAELKGWVSARRQMIEEIHAQIDLHTTAVAERDRAGELLRQTETELEDRRRKLDQQTQALDQVRLTHRDAVQQWAGSAVAIGVARAQEVVGAVLDIDADPLAEVREITAAVAELNRTIAAEQAVIARDLQTEHARCEAERDALQAERDALIKATVVAPLGPDWRSARSERPDRIGAAFWELVEVRDGASESSIDGLEAALEASGLLDAWVDPDGSMVLPEGVADLQLGAGPTTQRSLAEILEPLAESPSPLASILAGIPLASHVDEHVGSDGPSVVMAIDGSFRLGPAVGRGRIRPAELLGAAARDRRRQARLAELEIELDQVANARNEIERRQQQLDADRAATEVDFLALPDGQPVRDAARLAEIAEARVDDAIDRRGQAQQVVTAAEDHVRAALRSLTVMAAQHGLPTSIADLAEVTSLVDRLDVAIDVWREAIERLEQSTWAETSARSDAEEASKSADEANQHLQRSEQQAASAQARVAALQSAAGAEYDELIERLRLLDAERSSVRVELDESHANQRRLAEESGRLRSGLEQATVERHAADLHRTETHRRFGDLGADGVLHEAGLDVEPVERDDGEQRVTAVLASARMVAADLHDIDTSDEHLERTNARLQESLHTARGHLAGRVDLDDRLTEHGWWVLAGSADGIQRSVADLETHLSNQLDAGRDELAADEEALFERTLAGSIRQALAHRIRAANALVDDINLQLGAVRTAAGEVGVKLKWTVDDEQPSAVKAARRLLLRDPACVRAGARADLHGFVRARVEQARADLGENAPWQERLRETLDYRSWHRFGLQVTHRDWDGMKPATDRLLAGLSTGERSVALHLPMLASIAAHYSNGDRASVCPRLILLDELFAGVDEANRSQLFGTFTTWDLDALFTSDHEWCTYASLDGIAIHFLHPALDDEPVTSTRFIWDGHARTQAARE